VTGARSIGWSGTDTRMVAVTYAETDNTWLIAPYSWRLRVGGPDHNCFERAVFYACIDKQRQQRDLSWVALAKTTRVSPPTIKRFATGDAIEVDEVLALLRWLGRPLEDFSRSNQHLN